MGNSKSIGQLLNELDAMQKQFNDLNEELVVKNKVKKRVKTELSSNKIDDSFFKTFSAPLTKKSKSKEKEPIIDEDTLSDNELMFELETEQNIVTGNDFSASKKSAKEKIKDDDSTISSFEIKEKAVNTAQPIEQKQNDIKKNEIIEINKSDSDKDMKIKDYSYLTIKERLKQIQKEIAIKEDIIKKEMLSNKQQDNTKVVSLKKYTSSSKVTSFDLQSNEVKNINSVLKPTPQTKISIEKEKNNVRSTVLQPKKEKALSSKKNNDIIDDEKLPINHNISSSTQKDNSMKTVDILTISILILLIVLLVTAWVLLF